MQRREFLKSSLVGSVALGSTTLPGLSATARADFAPMADHTLANLTLMGGPDMRHLLPPAFKTSSGSYGHNFWKHRSRAFGVADTDVALKDHWDDKYFHLESNGVRFGIPRDCLWLKKMWDAGNMAIVNNVVGGQTRDHSHCLLIMDQGNRDSGANDTQRSGWGGRLASAADSNVVSLTSVPRQFCFGAHSSGDITRYDNNNLVSASNTREIALYEAEQNRDQRWDRRGQMARTLKSYYAGLRTDVDSSSPFAVYSDHEEKLREFGSLVDARLKDVPEPALLTNLYNWNSDNKLHRPNFGLQMRNLHDAIACNDVLNMRVASLEYGGWDSHDGQAAAVEPQFNDLFGHQRGFDALYRNLPDSAKDNLVFVIAGEFGRQLSDNGGNGTDHGRGTTMLVIGNPVNGGIYGDMFPDNEIERMDIAGSDINGLTDFDHVFGAVSDWVLPGSSSSVFPDKANASLETNLNIGQLFA